MLNYVNPERLILELSGQSFKALPQLLSFCPPGLSCAVVLHGSQPIAKLFDGPSQAGHPFRDICDFIM